MNESEMTDGELRGVVLRKLYDVRHERARSIPNNNLDFGGLSNATVARIAKQLGEKDLLKGQVSDTKMSRGYFGKISAKGIDVVEGNREPPFSIKVDRSDRRSYDISDSSNFQTGDRSTQDNRQQIEDAFNTYRRAVEASDASEEEKQGLLSRLQSLASHPLSIELFGHLLG